MFRAFLLYARPVQYRLRAVPHRCACLRWLIRCLLVVDMHGQLHRQLFWWQLHRVPQRGPRAARLCHPRFRSRQWNLCLRRIHGGRRLPVHGVLRFVHVRILVKARALVAVFTSTHVRGYLLVCVTLMGRRIPLLVFYRNVHVYVRVQANAARTLS